MKSSSQSEASLCVVGSQEIINRLKIYKGKISINSLEGYIRQVIGWREFMRGIYHNYSPKMESSNFFNLLIISWGVINPILISGLNAL